MVLTFEEKKAWQNMCIMYIIYSFKICFTLLVFQLAQNWNQSSRRSKLCSEYFNTYYSKYIKRKTMQQKRKECKPKLSPLVICSIYITNLDNHYRISCLCCFYKVLQIINLQLLVIFPRFFSFHILTYNHATGTIPCWVRLSEI